MGGRYSVAASWCPGLGLHLVAGRSPSLPHPEGSGADVMQVTTALAGGDLVRSPAYKMLLAPFYR